MTTFVKNPGECSPLDKIIETPEQKKALRATKDFMRKFSSKIVLSLEQAGNISPGDELTQRDIEEIDNFFADYPETNISFTSEISQTRMELSVKTLGVLKSRALLRIFNRFLDIFDSFPSEYALQGIISTANAYKQYEGMEIISEEVVEEKRRILRESLIRGQEDAIQNGIYQDSMTIKRKEERLKSLKNNP